MGILLVKWTSTKAQTLIEALKEGFPESSNGARRSWLIQERVYVNSKVASHTGFRVEKGQEIFIGKKKVFIDEGIEILYEDDSMVAVYKPAGILSVATDYSIEENVHSYLKRRFKKRRVFPVHRLDREASGVMIFAYTELAQQRLKKRFETHDLKRQYIAVVEGSLTPKQGTWESYLFEDESYYVRSVSDPSIGERAITHYKVIKTTKNACTLLVTLETGKKNQIRVHCSEAGHPILGDKKYGSSLDQPGRIGLHAFQLQIKHPKNEKLMIFEKKPPVSFTKYLPRK